MNLLKVFILRDYHCLSDYDEKKVNPIGETDVYYIFLKIHHLKAHNFTESTALSST